MQSCQHKLLCDTWEWEQATAESRKNIPRVKVHPLKGLQNISNNSNSNDSSLSKINCANSSVFRAHAHTSHKTESPRKMFQCMLDFNLWIILQIFLLFCWEYSSAFHLYTCFAGSGPKAFEQIFIRYFTEFSSSTGSQIRYTPACSNARGENEPILLHFEKELIYLIGTRSLNFKHISDSVLCLVCAHNNQIYIRIVKSFSSSWLSTQV